LRVYHMRALGHHRVRDTGPPLSRLEPRLVTEVAVRARAEDDRALRLELGMQLGEFLDLRRTDEGEITRVEEEDDPLPPVVRQLHRLRRGLAANVCFSLERRRFLNYSELHVDSSL